MTHPYTKLADALDITARWLGGGLAATPKDIANVSEAASILRAAVAVDVAGLMKLASAYGDECGALVMQKETGNALSPPADRRTAWENLESALRMALAGREGFVLVPVEPHTGDNYAAGLWSRRNWDAALEDQAAAPKGTP